MNKSPVMFVLATVYRPPGHHTYFIKEFADFLSQLVLAADNVLIVGDFKYHVIMKRCIRISIHRHSELYRG